MGGVVPIVAASGIVLQAGPRVLVVQRGAAPLAGIWTFPGGKVHGGESIAEAVEREVLEETGLRVVAGELVQIVEIVQEGYHYVIHEHLATLLDPDDEPRPSGDVQAARFVTPNELAALGTTEETRRVLARALSMARISLEDE